jgi:hypothetical protein
MTAVSEHLVSWLNTGVELHALVSQHVAALMQKLTSLPISKGISSAKDVESLEGSVICFTNEVMRQDVEALQNLEQLDKWIASNRGLLCQAGGILRQEAACFQCRIRSKSCKTYSIHTCLRIVGMLENFMYPFFHQLHADIASTLQSIDKSVEKSVEFESCPNRQGLVPLFPMRLERDEQELAVNNQFDLIALSPLVYRGRMRIVNQNISFVMELPENYPVDPFKMFVPAEYRHPSVQQQTVCSQVLAHLWCFSMTFQQGLQKVQAALEQSSQRKRCIAHPFCDHNHPTC